MRQPDPAALNIKQHFKPAGIATAPGKQAANVTHTPNHYFSSNGNIIYLLNGKWAGYYIALF